MTPSRRSSNASTFSDSSPLSDATTCTLPSAEETQAILDTHATDDHDLIREAQSCINNHLPAGGRSAKILHAILNHAPSDHGRTYSRVAIINCCFGEQSKDERVHRLTRLASEWEKYLILAFCRASRNISPPPSPCSSAGPEDTVKFSSFHQRLLKRQNGKCAVIDAGGSKLMLDAARIIKRSLAVEDDQNHSKSFLITWDIIRNYAGVSIDQVDSTIDSPENGVLMEVSMHRCFDLFEWCFMPTERPNEYTIKWFKDQPFISHIAGHKQVTFSSSSNNISLPNAGYLALHTAMAHILHDTGLHSYFGNLMDHYLPEIRVIPWGKFNDVDIELRVSVFEMFRDGPGLDDDEGGLLLD